MRVPGPEPDSTRLAEDMKGLDFADKLILHQEPHSLLVSVETAMVLVAMYNSLVFMPPIQGILPTKVLPSVTRDAKNSKGLYL